MAFDLEAWQVSLKSNDLKGEAAFRVVIEADAGSGFQQVVDFGTVSTGRTLDKPLSGSTVNGNGSAYRTTFDSGVLDMPLPVGTVVRTRWIGTDSAKNVVFGLDNGSLRSGFAGDANIDGVFNSTDLIRVFQIGEYEDLIAHNSGWSDGDWDDDDEFTSGDLVAAFQRGQYVEAATPWVVPEPSSAIVALLGGLGIVALTRTRTELENRYQ